VYRSGIVIPEFAQQKGVPGQARDDNATFIVMALRKLIKLWLYGVVTLHDQVNNNNLK